MIASFVGQAVHYPTPSVCICCLALRRGPDDARRSSPKMRKGKPFCHFSSLGVSLLSDRFGSREDCHLLIRRQLAVFDKVPAMSARVTFCVAAVGPGAEVWRRKYSRVQGRGRGEEATAASQAILITFFWRRRSEHKVLSPGLSVRTARCIPSESAARAWRAEGARGEKVSASRCRANVEVSGRIQRPGMPAPLNKQQEQCADREFPALRVRSGRGGNLRSAQLLSWDASGAVRAASAIEAGDGRVGAAECSHSDRGQSYTDLAVQQC